MRNIEDWEAAGDSESTTSSRRPKCNIHPKTLRSIPDIGYVHCKVACKITKCACNSQGAFDVVVVDEGMYPKSLKMRFESASVSKVVSHVYFSSSRTLLRGVGVKRS